MEKSLLLERLAGLRNFGLITQLQPMGKVARVAALDKTIRETIVPLLGPLGSIEAEEELPEYVNLLALAANDEQVYIGQIGSILEREAKIFWGILQALPKRKIGSGEVKRRLLRTLVDWWFVSAPNDARNLFSFLVEVSRNKEDPELEGVISQELRDDRHKDVTAVRSKLEDALGILGKDCAYIGLPTLMKTVSAWWQRSLDPGLVPALAGVSRAIESLPSSALQKALADFSEKAVALDQIARFILDEVFANDSLLHDDANFSTQRFDAKEEKIYFYLTNTAGEYNETLVSAAIESLQRNREWRNFAFNKGFRHLSLFTSDDGIPEFGSAEWPRKLAS